MITLYRYVNSWSTPSKLLPKPVLWMEYAATRTAGTIAHNLIGGGIGVTHRPAAARRVRLRLLYPLESDARTCANEHALGGMFHIEHTDRISMTMNYAPVGEITCILDPETADVWIVEIDVQELIQ